LIWLFRAEFTNLELGALTFLDQVLKEAYRIGDTEAARSNSHEDAFRNSVERVKGEIDHQIAVNDHNTELQRLRKLVDAICIPDSIYQIFEKLAENTRAVYRHAS